MVRQIIDENEVKEGTQSSSFGDNGYQIGCCRRLPFDDFCLFSAMHEKLDPVKNFISPTEKASLCNSRQ